MMARIIVAITGASGGPIAVRLLEALTEGGHEIGIVASDSGTKVMGFETGKRPEDFEGEGITVYDNSNLAADISSGTSAFDAMIVAPCSTSTLAKINCGIADNLITRVAAVSIKEGRKLVLVPREMPLSSIALRNMKELSEIGVVIIPPVMEFYTKPQSIDDMVSFVAGRALDSVGIKHNLYSPWKGE